MAKSFATLLIQRKEMYQDTHPYTLNLNLVSSYTTLQSNRAYIGYTIIHIRICSMMYQDRGPLALVGPGRSPRLVLPQERPWLEDASPIRPREVRLDTSSKQDINTLLCMLEFLEHDNKGETSIALLIHTWAVVVELNHSILVLLLLWPIRSRPLSSWMVSSLPCYCPQALCLPPIPHAECG